MGKPQKITGHFSIKRIAKFVINSTVAGKIDWLWLIIFAGTIFRFYYPFYFNPLDHLYSDPMRHYLNATQRFDQGLFSYLDPPLPQLLLRAVFFIFGNTHFGIGLCFGLLCAITPWCWYLWGRLLFSSITKAKVLLATLIFMPQWLGIYGFFMDETFLLPVLGLALWLSWKAKKENRAKYVLLAVLAWAVTLCIKLIVLPLAIFVLPWLFYGYLKSNNHKWRASLTVFASVVFLLFSYLVLPLWVYRGLGATWIYPAGMGLVTHAYYVSGAQRVSASILRNNGPTLKIGPFTSTAMISKTFFPFSDWETWRSGTYDLQIDCRQGPFIQPIMPTMTLQNRLLYIAESSLDFFFSRSWPDDRMDDTINIIQVETRWLWGILAVFIFLLAWHKNRLKDIVVVLCIGSALIYVLSDSAPMEGRYRKPWEGVAVAAFIYLFNASRLARGK